jgi:hypothetical protein
MLATAHVQVVATACDLTPQALIKMRGWVFVKKKICAGAGSTYRYQSFANSVYKTLVEAEDASEDDHDSKHLRMAMLNYETNT